MSSSQSSKHPKHYASKISVGLNVNQAIPNAAATRVNFNAVIFDPLDEYDEAILFEFNPLETGYYFFHALLRLNGLAGGADFNIMIMQNALVRNQIYEQNIAGISTGVECSAFLYCTLGDSIYIEAWHNGGAGIFIAGNVDMTRFEGFRVG